MKKLFPTLLLTLYFLFVIFPHPALAINPYEYLRDIYSPAVYDDPNINLQKHVKETLEIIPIAMFDIGLNWLFPQGTNVIAQCVPASLPDLLAKVGDYSCFSTMFKNLFGQVQGPALAVAGPSTSKPWPQTLFTVENFKQSLSPDQLIPKVEAQGYGYGVLQGNTIAKLWTVVRNIAYLLSAFILIVVGIMIMFRVKISPQVVITIEQALPKFAITLLLITFSFAIVGLLIDLTYVFGYLVSMLISSSGITLHTNIDFVFDFANLILKTWNPAQIVNNPGMMFDVYFARAETANPITMTLLTIFFMLANLVALIAAFSSVLGPIGGLIGLIIIVFIFIGLLINIIRIYLALIGVYARLIISIITAPLQILFGVLPFGGGGFGSWLNSFLKSLVIFPLVSAMFLLGHVLIFSVSVQCWVNQGTIGDTRYCQGFAPPQLGGSIDFALALAGIGILLAIPGIPKAVEAFFAQKPFDLGSAIGQSIATPLGIGTGIAVSRAENIERAATSAPGGTAPVSATIVKEIARAIGNLTR